jgi:hypothetical protein
MHAHVMPDAVMGHNLALVRAGNEPHAAVLERRLLERNPDAHGVVFHLVTPIRLILMPGRFRADTCRLHDRVLTAIAAFTAKQLLSDRQRIHAKESVGQLRRVFHGIKNLRQLRLFAFVVRPAQIKLIPFFASGARSKQPVVNAPQPLHLVVGRDLGKREVSLVLIESDLLLRQSNRRYQRCHRVSLFMPLRCLNELEYRLPPNSTAISLFDISKTQVVSGLIQVGAVFDSWVAEISLIMALNMQIREARTNSSLLLCSSLFLRYNEKHRATEMRYLWLHGVPNVSRMSFARRSN